jgi:hypothetical protein
LLLGLAVLLLLVGCGSNDEQTDDITVTVPPLDTATATTTMPPVDSPLESPLQPTPVPVASCISLIEPSGNTICGYVYSEIDDGPVSGRPVFLAEALTAADGSVTFAALDQDNAPQGITDENGMFYVTDVPSDMYFLMLGEYPQPIMLKERDNPENDIFVDWREEEGAVDLGIITANVPSLQSP